MTKSREELVQEYTERIKQAISKGVAGDTKLDSDDIEIRAGKPHYKNVESMNQPEYWHILNVLCSYPDVVHTHVGFWRGASLFPCIEGNNAKIYGIDNFFSSPELKQEFLGHAERLGMSDKFILIDDDCFTFDLSRIAEKINFHLYDNGHELGEQYKGIYYFGPVLADVCIIMVDNFKSDNINTPKETEDAIEDLGYDIRYKYVQEAHCHQGYYVIEKR